MRSSINKRSPSVSEHPTFRCLHELLVFQSERTPEALAIGAPGRMPLSYGGLLRHVEDTVCALNDLGLGRNDHVAIVLPNGPELASALLGVAAGATAVPLNPAYQQSEYDFYLRDLGAKALVVQAGDTSPVRAAARALDIDLIELSLASDGEEAGLFDLSPRLSRSPVVPTPLSVGFAQPEDIAVVLPTSGTTARPKMVPLRQTNLCASARNIGAALQLSPQDRCLNVIGRRAVGRGRNLDAWAQEDCSSTTLRSSHHPEHAGKATC